MTTQGETQIAPDPVVTSIRTSREMYDRFREVAAAEHRSVSAHLRYVMEREVREHDERIAA